MLLLKELQMKNFLSHDDTKITFDENESLLLDGISGAGKSSVVEAVVWSLYGQGRSNNTMLVQSGAPKAKVILIVSNDGKNYKIEREISSTGKHSLSVSENNGSGKFVPIGVSGIKLVQAFIETKIVGASYSLFINSAVSPQDNSENFTKQTAAKKKDIILEIIKASDYDLYYDKAKENIKDRNIKKDLLLVEKRSKEDAVKSDKELSETLPSLKIDKAKALQELDDAQKALSVETLISENNKKVKTEVEKVIYDINSIQKQESLLNAKADKLKKEIDESGKDDIVSLQTELKGITVEEQELSLKKTVFSKQFSDLHTWLDNKTKIESDKVPNLVPILENDVASLNSKLIKILSAGPEECGLKHDHCPHIGKKRDEQINEISQELESKNALLLKNANDNVEFAQKLAGIGERPVYDSEADQDVDKKLREIRLRKDQINQIILTNGGIVEKKNNLDEILSELKNLSKIKELAESKKAEISKTLDLYVDNRIMALNGQISGLQTRIYTLDARLDVAEKAMERQSVFSEEIKLIDSKIVSLDLEITHLNTVKEAFGNNGIKSIVIDFVLPQLEDRINEVLSKVSDFKIKLETQKSNVSGDSLLEGLFVTIINGQGETFDLNNYSGGEKVKISAAISEGLAGLQKIGFRILDESVVGLDDSTIDNFVEVMTGIQERFRQIVCISHIQAVKDIFPRKLTIIKQNGVSYVR